MKGKKKYIIIGLSVLESSNICTQPPQFRRQKGFRIGGFRYCLRIQQALCSKHTDALRILESMLVWPPWLRLILFWRSYQKITSLLLWLSGRLFALAQWKELGYSEEVLLRWTERSWLKWFKPCGCIPCPNWERTPGQNQDKLEGFYFPSGDELRSAIRSFRK